MSMSIIVRRQQWSDMHIGDTVTAWPCIARAIVQFVQ
jgi:hypothetical protein